MNRKVITKTDGIINLIASPIQIQKKINKVYQEPKYMSQNSFILCILLTEELLKSVYSYFTEF